MKNRYLDRCEAIKNMLAQEAVDAIWIENTIDIEYLTGLHVSVGKVLVSLAQEPVLLVDSRYIEMAKNKSPFRAILDEEKSIKDWLVPLKKVIFDGSHLSWDKVTTLKKDYSSIDWVSTSSPLKKIRAIKDAEEIRLLRAAADLGSLGYDFVVNNLITGVSEKELAYKLDRFWKERGGEGFAFEPIIAFGENSAIPHWRASDRRLKVGDTVLIDIGVVLNGYHSDMTRTVYYGDPTTQLKEIYEVVQLAQARAFEFVKAGVTIKDLDRISRGYIEEKGYGSNYTHSLGHGIGLETHEWPFLRAKGPITEEKLCSGMCLTLEPGIYLPGIGGVRIEDTVLITDQDAESLTNRPTTLKVVHPHA